MTNGNPQAQALIPISLEVSKSAGAVMGNATGSKSPSTARSVASPVARESDTLVSQDQTKSITPAQRPEPRPLLASRCLSPDIMDEIRKVIRQECKYFSSLTIWT